MNLHVDIANLEAITRPLKAFPGELEKVLKSSLSRTGARLASTVARAIKSETYLKSSDIRAALKKPLVKGSGSVMEVEVAVSSVQAPIDKFKLIPNRITARKGVRSSSWRGPSYKLGPKTPVQSPDADYGSSKPFVARLGGKNRLLRRYGKKLKRVYGYSVQYFAVFDSVEKPALEDARAFFEKRLAHEVDYRLGRLA